MGLFDDPELLKSQQKIKDVVLRVGSIRESVKIIVKASPAKFLWVFSIFILPLSIFQLLWEINNIIAFNILVNNLIHLGSALDKVEFDSSIGAFIYQLVHVLYEQFVTPYFVHNNWVYLVLFFTFYLVSTCAMAFTVASLYLLKPLSYTSILHDVPRISKRLVFTFLRFFLLIFFSYVIACVVLPMGGDQFIVTQDYSLAFLIRVDIICAVFVLGHIISWLSFAVVVSVVQPDVSCSTAIEKGRKLVRDNIVNSNLPLLVVLYMSANYIVVRTSYVVILSDTRIVIRLLIGFLSVMALGMINFVGLISQNLMYYRNQGESDEGCSGVKEFGKENQV